MDSAAKYSAVENVVSEVHQTIRKVRQLKLDLPLNPSSPSNPPPPDSPYYTQNKPFKIHPKTNCSLQKPMPLILPQIVQKDFRTTEYTEVIEETVQDFQPLASESVVLSKKEEDRGEEVVGKEQAVSMPSSMKKLRIQTEMPCVNKMPVLVSPNKTSRKLHKVTSKPQYVGIHLKPTTLSPKPLPHHVFSPSLPHQLSQLPCSQLLYLNAQLTNKLTSASLRYQKIIKTKLMIDWNDLTQQVLQNRSTLNSQRQQVSGLKKMEKKLTVEYESKVLDQIQTYKGRLLEVREDVRELRGRVEKQQRARGEVGEIGKLREQIVEMGRSCAKNHLTLRRVDAELEEYFFNHQKSVEKLRRISPKVHSPRSLPHITKQQLSPFKAVFTKQIQLRSNHNKILQKVSNQIDIKLKTVEIQAQQLINQIGIKEQQLSKIRGTSCRSLGNESVKIEDEEVQEAAAVEMADVFGEPQQPQQPAEPQAHTLFNPPLTRQDSLLLNMPLPIIPQRLSLQPQSQIHQPKQPLYPLQPPIPSHHKQSSCSIIHKLKDFSNPQQSQLNQLVVRDDWVDTLAAIQETISKCQKFTQRSQIVRNGEENLQHSLRNSSMRREDSLLESVKKSESFGRSQGGNNSKRISEIRMGRFVREDSLEQREQPGGDSDSLIKKTLQMASSTASEKTQQRVETMKKSGEYAIATFM